VRIAPWLARKGGTRSGDATGSSIAVRQSTRLAGAQAAGVPTPVSGSMRQTAKLAVLPVYCKIFSARFPLRTAKNAGKIDTQGLRTPF